MKYRNPLKAEGSERLAALTGLRLGSVEGVFIGLYVAVFMCATEFTPFSKASV